MSKKGKRQAEKAAPEQDGDGLTGMFSNDFPLQCVQNGLPPVTVRQLPQSQRLDSTGNEIDNNISSTHCVYIETNNNTNTLKAIHIRNVLLDKRFLSALTAALDNTQLSDIILWNVGLNDVSEILPMIKTCNVRRLVLDGNQLSSDSVVTLLQSTSLEHLSLKCCCLGDAFCAAINPVLAGNQTLLSLDLSSNHITDEGLTHVANSLRTNRTLLSLCLSGNRISDDGVSELCKVLVRFPLTKDEESKRKSLLATNNTSTESGLNSSGRSPSGVSLSGRGSRGAGKGKKELKKDEKDHSGKSSVIGKAAGKSSKVTGSKKVVKGEEKDDSGGGLLGSAAGGSGVCDPLVELVKEDNGILWMSGNTTLSHLTLSCNRIGERGVASLLDVLHTQSDSSTTVTSSDLSSDKTECIGSGLLRVTIENNLIPANNDQLIKITSWMRSHDPLLTTPTS